MATPQPHPCIRADAAWYRWAADHPEIFEMCSAGEIGERYLTDRAETIYWIPEEAARCLVEVGVTREAVDKMGIDDQDVWYLGVSHKEVVAYSSS